MPGPIPQGPVRRKTIGPSRKVPLLSQDQLEAMVLDPRWGLTVPPGFAQQAEQAITPYLDQSRKP